MPNHTFGAWQLEAPTQNGSMAVYSSRCDGDPARVNDIDSNGLISRSGYDGAWTPWDDGRGWVMHPAPGTKVLGLSWAGTLRRPSTPAGTEGWTTRIADTGTGAVYLGCAPNTGSCTYNETVPQWLPVPSNGTGDGIEVGSYCVSIFFQACLNAWTSPYYNTAAAALARVRYASVRVEDESAPAVAVTGGRLAGSAWLHGTQSVVYSSSDNSGVRANRLYVDGAQLGPDTTRSCDFTESAPCPPSVSDTYGVATGSLSNGAHSLRVEGVDAAGNATSTAGRTFRVDNTAPETSVLGAGTAGASSPGPREVTLLGTDQARLSGMGGADADQPVTGGGHLDYQLDGGPTVQVRGGEASLSVSEPGRHTITFRAYDVAQNASAARTVTVDVGGPPEPATDEPQPGFADSSSSTATFTAAPSFAATCPPQATLAASAVAAIDEGTPSRALGPMDALLVRSQAGHDARSLLAVELPAIGDCAVLSAQLRMHQESGPTDRALNAHRLGSEWAASSVTWDDRPGATGGAAAGESAGAGWLSFDVTAQVRGMYRDGNDGLVVEDVAENAPDAQAETFSQPQLVVTFG
ncbi:MAG: DNRLRE domain-containing protein [Thermoleophilaceae bacterium]